MPKADSLRALQLRQGAVEGALQARFVSKQAFQFRTIRDALSQYFDLSPPTLYGSMPFLRSGPGVGGPLAFR